MIGRVNQIHQLWRHFGPEWLAYRLGYATRTRLGLLRRRIPATDWDAQPLKGFLSDAALGEPEIYLSYRRAQAPAFFFSHSDREAYQSHFADWDVAAVSPQLLSDELRRGRVRYFERTTAETGFPPDWHANPFTDHRAPANLHWSRIADFGQGDIKIIWEASRFGFAYWLVRAYWRTGDDRYAETFWRMVEDWRAHNLPQRGANWKCGQETSFRVMAWCFGLYGLLAAEATTAARAATLAQMIAVSANRIESNLDYALSQRNNHGISEGAGLWTVGALFPELRDSEKWKAMGSQALESQGRELIYTDGAFSQHSVNYQRLMLHDYLWALRLGEILNRPFSAELKQRVKSAGDFLYQIQDDASGQVPYYGQNDGALILPLDNCDYKDFRPVVQAVRYLATGTRCYESGPWDEDLLWLFGPAALEARVEVEERTDLEAEAGGYYTLRAAESFIFTRAATFRHRPAQADMLHVDLWWRGQNIAVDAGTYSYNAPAPWDNSLAQTAYHNTVSVDGQDQMERAARFLWLPWVRGRVRCRKRSSAGHLSYWEGEHDGYERLPAPARHRRAVLRMGESWIVIDDLDSLGRHTYRLHWLLADLPYEWNQESGRLTLHTQAGQYYVQAATLSGGLNSSVVRADALTPRGWRAPYYNYREPALSMELTATATALRFWTLFAAEACRVTADQSRLKLEGERWHALIDLQAGRDGQGALIASASTAGCIEDDLELR